MEPSISFPFFIFQLSSFSPDMFGNSSSFSPFVPRPSSANSSSHISCYVYGESVYITSAYMLTRIFLLLPLSVYILHHGYPLWWGGRSTPPSSTPCHSNHFTFHMVIMELIAVLGYAICCCGIFALDMKAMSVGNAFFAFTWYGEICFHMLTCVEHYLAVFFPITFLSLRNERGSRIRNVSIGCVWIFCCLALACALMKQFLILDLCLLISALSLVSFCSFAILWVLIHPAPGGQKVKEKTNQVKKRAFHTTAVIWAVLLIRFVCDIIWEILYMSASVKACVILTSISWSNLPSCLVLPLLYLHRAGKLMCRKTRHRMKK